MTFKKKITDVVVLGTSNVGSSIILGLFWLYLATFLSKLEYGELGFLMSVANVGFGIAFLGIAAVITVYEPKNQNVFPASFVLGLISASITGIIVFILTNNVAASILIIGMTVFFTIQAGLISKKRYKNSSIHTLLRASSIVIVSIILYHFFGINGILLGYFIASLFVLKELYSFMKNNRIDFSLLRNKVGFMTQMWANRFSGIIVLWGDKLLIGSMFGFTFLAHYQFAAQYLLLLNAIPTSIGQYLLPQESEGLKNKKIKIFSIGIAVLITIISILVAPFGINAFLPDYEDSIVPIQILSVAITPLTISAILQAKLLGKEQSRVILIGSIVQACLYLILVIVLGNLFGLIGIAVGFLLAATVRTTFDMVVSYRKKK